MRLFKNRIQAAQELSENLAYLKNSRPVVVALANGGVPVGEIVARSLEAPLDVLVIEKLFVAKYPGQCVGVVDEHGRISVVHGSSRWHSLTAEDLGDPARDVFPEVQRRHTAIRTIMPEIEVRGRMVILVDEGVATGAKMLGAAMAMKDRGAARVIVAAPGGASQGTWQLHAQADEVVIPHRPAKFKGVAFLYEEFREVTDGMVQAVLEGWMRDHPTDHGGVKSVVLKLTNTRGESLMCEIDLPVNLQRGQRYPAVVFAHGMQSSARSCRALAVSERLAQRGVVGVRMDFTGHGRSGGSIHEATDRQMRDDLRTVLQSIVKLKEVDRGRLAVVGSGTGAMIALQHAEDDPSLRALVLRGPVCKMDLVHASAVQAPTLLIHAEEDTQLLNSVQTLDRELASRHRLVRIAHTNRMFPDAVGMDAMVSATVEWLVEQLFGEMPLARGIDAGNGHVDSSRAQPTPA